MTDDLKARLRAIGDAKASSAAEDAAEYLALSMSERLRRTIELSEQCIANSSRIAEENDDELIAWSRVQERLRKRAREQAGR